MSDTSSPNEIERDIERERAELAHSVHELQDRFSPDRIVAELGRGLSEHGSDIGRAVSASVKRNPVALAITGVGLAWLMSGKSWELGDENRKLLPNMSSKPKPAPTPDVRTGTVLDPVSGEVRPAARPRPTAATSATIIVEESDWMWADDDHYWDDDEDDGPSMTERAAGTLGEARDAAADARARAGAKAHDGKDAISDRLHAGADSVRDGAAAARDRIGASADHAAERARRIRRRLSEGTESLSEQARERVIAARWQAVKARRKAARQASRGADWAADAYQQNPLVGGLLAMAAGALLAGTLPRTKQEDELIGRQSDAAFDDAERVFRAEVRKARKVAERAGETARDIAEEKRAEIDEAAPGDKSMASQVADEVRDAASRVGDAAQDEAEKQKLGQSKG